MSSFKKHLSLFEKKKIFQSAAFHFIHVTHEFLALGTVYAVKMGTKRKALFLFLVYKNRLLPLQF